MVKAVQQELKCRDFVRWNEIAFRVPGPPAGDGLGRWGCECGGRFILTGAVGIGVTLGETRQTLAAMALTELDLGLTFLDVAATTADASHARRSVSNAITALRAADKFLSELSPEAVNVEAIKQRRERLAQRLRDLVEK